MYTLGRGLQGPFLGKSNKPDKLCYLAVSLIGLILDRPPSASIYPAVNSE